MKLKIQNWKFKSEIQTSKFETENSKLNTKLKNWAQCSPKINKRVKYPQKQKLKFAFVQNWNWNWKFISLETGWNAYWKTGWNAYWNLATCARPLMAQLESRRREQTNLKLSAMSWALEIGSDGNGPLASALHVVLVLRLYVRGNLSGTCRLPWT